MEPFARRSVISLTFSMKVSTKIANSVKTTFSGVAMTPLLLFQGYYCQNLCYQTAKASLPMISSDLQVACSSAANESTSAACSMPACPCIRMQPARRSVTQSPHALSTQCSGPLHSQPSSSSSSSSSSPDSYTSSAGGTWRGRGRWATRAGRFCATPTARLSAWGSPSK